jgi:hypothetical protein
MAAPRSASVSSATAAAVHAVCVRTTPVLDFGVTEPSDGLNLGATLLCHLSDAERVVEALPRTEQQH